MRLTDLEFKGNGRFLRAKASFRIERFFTPAPWDYIYTNRRVLLRLRHDGGGYVQLDPPGGTVLHKAERFQKSPSLLVWIKPEGESAFSNFYKPHFDTAHPAREPLKYTCTFSPAKAVFALLHQGIQVITEIAVAEKDPAVLIHATIKNLGRSRHLDIFPVWRPHNTSSTLAPWDVPEIYQTSRYCNDPDQAIWVETRDPGGMTRRRRRAFFITDMEVQDAEVYLDRFVGKGTWDVPEAVLRGKLSIDARRSCAYLGNDVASTALCCPPVAAFHRRVLLDREESVSFSLVLAGLPQRDDGAMPSYDEIGRYSSYFRKRARVEVVRNNDVAYLAYQSQRRIETPDKAFNRYVNEWLPLQLRWVTMLDRGWPTGLRGTRDAAQDFTGWIPLSPEEARLTLLAILACQRSDGWFPRQFSTEGPEGRHDLRPYVDAGCWVWELLYDYIRFTGDLDILNTAARWLDLNEASSVLAHARAIFSYYLAPENLGEHGLVKIREGDWNDSINAAGLEGRGESVMVSCQFVLACRQAADVFVRAGVDADPIRIAASDMRERIRRHALSSEGYLNGLFNDDGHWIFSPKDPDGRRRINSPVNAFGVIAGIFEESELPGVFAELKALKHKNGYALFEPGIGDPPIQKLGRIGQGDLHPGILENGSPYNHGSHGFLGRAAAVAGEGNLLADILKYMLPYDPEAHPIEISETAPYAVVNHWSSLDGQFGKGGSTFLTGSIGTALRNVYGGMMGFEPEIEGLRIRPAIPSAWTRLSYEHSFRGNRFSVTIENPAHRQSGVKYLEMNGRHIEGNFVPTTLMTRSNRVQLTVVMG